MSILDYLDRVCYIDYSIRTSSRADSLRLGPAFGSGCIFLIVLIECISAHLPRLLDIYDS